MTTEDDSSVDGDYSDLASMLSPRVELIQADTLIPESIRWLWPGWLARGKLHLLAGAPGTGKTTIAMTLAAAISSGSALPCGHCPAVGGVLIWSGEDDFADTLLPRLIAAGADLSRVYLVGVVREAEQSRAFDPAYDMGELAVAAEGRGDISLIIVDPLVSAIRGDSHKNAEVRRGLAPLVDLANRLDACALGITHFSKSTGARDPVERVTGSIAFSAQARIVMGTVRKAVGEECEQEFILARAKSNIGPDGGGYAYGFEQVPLKESVDVTGSRVVWGDAVEGTARGLLSEPTENESNRSALAEAETFLTELLSSGAALEQIIRVEANSRGLSWASIKRAKSRLKIISQKGGMTTGWEWSMSSKALNEGEGAHTNE